MGAPGAKSSTRSRGERYGVIIRAAADGAITHTEATALLDTIRWLARVTNHLARIARYLHAQAHDASVPS